MITILEGYRGSLAHGTLKKDSEDIDIMRVVLPNPLSYLGISRPFEGNEHKQGKYDIVIYSLHKYLRLLVNGNPNVLSLLWIKDEHYIKRHAYGKELILNRRKLMGRKTIYKSFCGYASGQMKRMTAIQKYSGYMGEKRKALVDKYGYDTKNASHLIRLLRMCYECLKFGDINVYRSGMDAQELIDIKNGAWDLEYVKSTAAKLFDQCKIAFDKSKMQDYPDFVWAEEYIQGVMLEELAGELQ
jgi:predicted nucleotidyltransferase